VCVAANLTGEEEEVVRSAPSGRYSGTVVAIAAAMSSIVVFATAGIVALVVRQVQRHRRRKQAHRRVDLGRVSAPGIQTLPSGCAKEPAT